MKICYIEYTNKKYLLVLFKLIQKMKKIFILFIVWLLVLWFSNAEDEISTTTSESSDKKIVTSEMPTEPTDRDPYKITLTQYEFDWELPVNSEQIEASRVYLWINSITQNDSFLKLVDKLNFDYFDLSKLENKKIWNISLYEDKANWFRINIDFENWYVSIYRNYSYQYKPYQETQNKIDEKILSNDEIIDIANKFLDKFKIDRSKYWNPEIENQDFVVYKSMSTNSSNSNDNNYVPEYVNVLYPFTIDWNEVNEIYWGKYWLRLTVSTRNWTIDWFTLRIEDVSQTQNITKISDKNKILEIAKNWWSLYPYNYWSEYNIEYITQKLINPKLKYVVANMREWNNMKTYYTPAIEFEIEQTNNNDWNNIDGMSYYSNYNQKITVPLIEEAHYKY